MDYLTLKNYAQDIINTSLLDILDESKQDFSINEKLKKYENNIFNLSDEINTLLDNKINYFATIQLIDENSVENLKWLKSLAGKKDLREELSLKFPIELVVIVEGITEETLLPTFAEKLGYNFNKKGVQVVSAGGKNQVVKLFYTLSEQLKIPIFVLLDNDAKENLEQIKPKLRSNDKIHLLNGGEFEDILPKKLILKTLNDHFRNLNSIDESEFVEDRMVLNLEEIFKKKGFHEFKKAEFAQLIKAQNIVQDDISEEIKEIIHEITECQAHAFL